MRPQSSALTIARAPRRDIRLVTTTGLVDRVIVIPRNGYANRLQAWASAQILADQVSAPLRVLWEPESVATTPAESLFSADLIDEQFVSTDEVTSLLGMPHVDFPRYLTHHADRGILVLAGHDRGEETFVRELGRLLNGLSQPTTLVIIAGGLFRLPGSSDAEAGRRSFYRQLRWSAPLDDLVESVEGGRPPYAALHVRQTDRSLQAPTEREMRRGLSRVSALIPERSLLICADTEAARVQWAAIGRELGFDPWSIEGVEFDRGSVDNGIFALLDWRLLSSASGVVHAAASTFSTEAVIAGGVAATSVPLQAGTLIKTRRRVRSAVESIVTYPERRRALGT